jgi:hypothetical protein
MDIADCPVEALVLDPFDICCSYILVFLFGAFSL